MLIRKLTKVQLGAMLLFALSCFLLLTFLWINFGGSTPLSARGYRLQVDFPEASSLVATADVRIAGVKVGTVASTESYGDRTRTTLQIDSDYAPRPVDTHAVLRNKTLIGETYVELTPGDDRSGMLSDGGLLPRGAVNETVQLDEIFRSFDAPTRRAFQNWLDAQGRALAPHGRDLNAALARVVPFEDGATTLLAITNQQSGDVSRLVRGTGTVFDSLSAGGDQLRQLIVNLNRVFATTAARNQDLSAAVTVLPTFLAQARATTRRLTTFTAFAHPLVNQLRPAARLLSPTLVQVKAITPDLKRAFAGLGPLTSASKNGVPAVERVLDDLKPVLDQVEPFLRSVNPMLRYLAPFKREITAFFANGAAAGQGVDRPGNGNKIVHYLRLTNPINPENLAVYPHRLTTNRTNPYSVPGAYANVPIPTFGSYLCTSTPVPALAPEGTVPDLPPGVTDTVTLSPAILALVQQLVLDPAQATPRCKAQSPLGGVIGQQGSYPHVTRDPAR